MRIGAIRAKSILEFMYKFYVKKLNNSMKDSDGKEFFRLIQLIESLLTIG